MTGRFGCVVRPGDKIHQRSILRLVGKSTHERQRIQRERYEREEEIDRLYASV